ncbi:DNA-binding transcriptional LysR family regulator [Microbacterium resistens]|uniref:DNA-binding transcriptional LysR family regulator n=1 Tax=Microbacterium resistens TaxID=156977 RepID=A0ABU1SGB1_9MICO|nr:LysR family transcriptional regulator [Microbacterium resistens]MDR6868648.1 DNA-binding transcriptional LysR family regulator [Microbacterium resistens]
MCISFDLDDLTLVRHVAEMGSIGAAARRLNIAQPSASARLTRLEQRLGVELFTRGARGATPTPSGHMFAQRAAHILGHLDALATDVATASEEPPLRIGCFHGLADSVLPILDAHRGTQQILQSVDHGVTLVEWVAEGTIHAAVVSILGQLGEVKRVTSHPIGRDHMVVLVPVGVEPPRGGRLPLKDRALATATYDLRDHDLVARIIALGGRPRLGATVTATIRMARLSGDLAVIPASSAATDLLPGERIVRLPFNWSIDLTMVTRPQAPAEVLRLAEVLGEKLGLRAPAEGR